MTFKPVSDIEFDTSIDSGVEAVMKNKLEGYASQDAQEARDDMFNLVRELEGSLNSSLISLSSATADSLKAERTHSISVKSNTSYKLFFIFDCLHIN